MDFVEYGRKGGYARGEKYKKYARRVIAMFISKPNMTQHQIAKKVGISQAFVSKYTNNPFVQQEKFNRIVQDITKDLSEEDLDKILLKSKLESLMFENKDVVKSMKEKKVKI